MLIRSSVFIVFHSLILKSRELGLYMLNSINLHFDDLYLLAGKAMAIFLPTLLFLEHSNSSVKIIADVLEGATLSFA